MSVNEDMFGLQGKCAVVTGGAGVIPGAMSEALVGAGAKVSIWGRGTGHPVDEAVEELGKRTGRPDLVHGVQVDTADKEAVKEAFLKTEREIGTPDILVNGVGGNMGRSSFVDTDLEVFEKVLKLNLVAGLMIPLQVFAGAWIEHKRKGTVINISSMASYIPLSAVWAYDAAKAGTLSLTMGAAKEFAPYGIRVNGIAPGFFIGHQNRALLIRNDETGELTDRGKAVIAHTPFGRFGEADEIRGATVFLASEKASGFITGVTIPVDGGYLIQNI